MPADAKVAIRNVWKSYARATGRLSALEDVSFEIADGEFVSIVGPSGCGKSTLLHMLSGFERPDRGEALMDGRAVRAPSPRARADRAARIGLPVDDGAAQPAVRRGAAARRAEREEMVRRYIELVGLAGFEDSFPAQLSGGMLQRVEVARALMARPDVLYMDEPFGALDALTRLRMRAELQRILARDRHTCLLVTHDVEEALHLSDRVVVMTPRPGRIQCIVEVDAPHPRELASAPLVALKQRVLRELGLSDDEVERDTAPRPPPAPVARGARVAPRRRAAAARLPARADVVVIGGGPAGASAAAILAENGRSVIVLERDPFPRYHVGESLLPALWELWDRLGVTAQIEAAGFVAKQGIRFARPRRSRRRRAAVRGVSGVLPALLHLSRRSRALRCAPARQRARQGRRRARGLDGLATCWMEDDWVKGVLAAPNGEAPRADRRRRGGRCQRARLPARAQDGLAAARSRR